MNHSASERALSSAHAQMLNQQCRAWGVRHEQVLNTLAQIDRAEFVPPALVNLAYADWRAPLGLGQTMLSPKIEARFLQALDVKPYESILEIGTGSGYLTACLANLGSQVTSLEYHADLLDIAQRNLQQHQFDNVILKHQDFLSFKTDASFDVMLFSTSLPKATKQHFACLKVGGRALVVLGEGSAMQTTLVSKHDETYLHREVLFETQLEPLIGAVAEPQFEF